MAEFCTCGSIKIGGNCTNKNCANRENVKSSASKSRSKSKSIAKPVTAGKLLTKSLKPRKASKVITYNLYDIKEEEEVE